MKKQLILLALSTLVIPAMAQETNTFRPRNSERPDWKNRERPEFQEKKPRQEPTPEQMADHQERRLKFMEKMLKEIGVTEEEQAQIFELQKVHHQKMKAVSQKTDEARRALSKLQDEGASEAELDAAIDAVSDAQSEQLKILVRNRMEMEKILGKEKNELFMETARQQFRKHGRRGGSGMPQRPGEENRPNTRENTDPVAP